MPTKLSNAAQRAWLGLGIGADLHGRLAFGVLAISSAVGGYTFMRERVETISAIIVAVCVTLIMLSLSRLYVALQRTLAEEATERSRQSARECDERKVLRQREALGDRHQEPY